jgi:hypothetical protein
MNLIFRAPSIGASCGLRVPAGPGEKKPPGAVAWRWVSGSVSSLRAPIDSFRQGPEKTEEMEEVEAAGRHR